MQDTKIDRNSPSGHHRATLSGHIFATKARIDNRKKTCFKQHCLSHMSSKYGELRLTSGWDLLASLGHPSTFQRVLRLGSVTARHSSSGRQPNLRRWTDAVPPIFGRAAIDHVGHWPTI